MDYISLQKRQLLDSLENQARFSQLMAVVIGEHGIGKSAVAEALQQRVQGDLLLAPVNASIDLSQSQLEKAVRLQLGLPWQETSRSIGESLQEISSKRTLLMVDDAHLLSTNCLNYLVSLVVEESNRSDSKLFILLLGEMSLAKKLDQTEVLSLHPELCVVLEIERIQENEVLPLIAEFQNLNIELATKLYPPQRLSYFYQLSKGVPAELKAQVSRWLEARADAEQPSVKRRKSWHSWVYLAVASVFFLLVYFHDAINSALFDSSGVATSANDNVTQKSSDAVNAASSSNSTENSRQNSVKSAQRRQENLVQDNLSKNSVEGEDSAENVASTTTRDQTIKKASTSNVEQKLKDIEQSAATKLENTTTESTHSNADIVNDHNAADITTDDSTSAITSSTSSIPNKQIMVKEEATKPGELVTKDKKQPLSEDGHEKYTDDEAGLLMQNADYFTLQWAALSQLEAAIELKNKLLSAALNSVKIIRRKRGDQVLYLVISGEYSDKPAAMTDGLKQAQAVGVDKPWAKSIRAVQQGLPN